jgi:hypothetical protein
MPEGAGNKASCTLAMFARCRDSASLYPCGSIYKVRNTGARSEVLKGAVNDAEKWMSASSNNKGKGFDGLEQRP